MTRQWARRVEGLHPCGRGPSVGAGQRWAARQALNVSPKAEHALGQRADRTRTNRIDHRQVTTATPAGLDFRAAEAAGEGLRTRCSREALQVCVALGRSQQEGERRCRKAAALAGGYPRGWPARRERMDQARVATGAGAWTPATSMPRNLSVVGPSIRAGVLRNSCLAPSCSRAKSGSGRTGNEA